MGKENTPIFVDMPYIKSITFGMKIDPMCKHLLWDVCRERGIECYEIAVDTFDFGLSRKMLEEEITKEIIPENVLEIVSQLNDIVP